jgi:methionyl-tRNA formyltransferase
MCNTQDPPLGCIDGKALPSDIQYDRILRIVETLRVTVSTNGRGLLVHRLVFMGTPHFGRIILGALDARYDVAAVVTQPDRRAGRGRKPVLSPVKALAQDLGLPVLQPPRITPETIEQLHDISPEAIIVAASGHILPPRLLALPPHGCINVHASLLPRHRGAAPVAAAILSGDAQTGVTIMLMEAEVDHGPTLGQASMAIAPDDTTGSLTGKLAYLGAHLLLETLPRWLVGEIIARPQDHRLATHNQRLRRDEGRICWDETSHLIARRCRAYNPWPGAFAMWGEKELKIWKAHATEGECGNAAPGLVISVDKEYAVVTGEGLLVLDEVQLAGRRPMHASDFGRGQRFFVGSTLR